MSLLTDLTPQALHSLGLPPCESGLCEPRHRSYASAHDRWWCVCCAIRISRAIRGFPDRHIPCRVVDGTGNIVWKGDD